MSSRSTMSSWVEERQSRGCYAFTREQAESETQRSFVATQTALRRLKKQGRIVSPRRGYYVVVPPEYRAVGSPPASWFIDDLMRHFAQPYYVALLSAAAIHGAGHQQSMIFQVATSKPTREIRCGKVAIRFLMNNKVEQMPVIEMQTETGIMRVATAETTAFDLVRYRVHAGYLSNAATVVAELAERIDPEALVKIAPLVRLPDVQRLGYLLDAVEEFSLSDPLSKWLSGRNMRAVQLSPEEPATHQLNKRWHVQPNVKLEIDL